MAFLVVLSWSSYSLAQKNSTISATNTKLEKAYRDIQRNNDQLENKNVLLDQQYKEAAQARQLAYDRAKQAIDSYKLVIDKARESLARNPMLRDFLKDLILLALDGLERLPDDPADKVANSGLQKAKAEEYFYQTYLHLGEPSKAAPHIEIALTILRERNRLQATDTTRFNLAACLLAKAEARQSFERDMEVSLACREEAVALLESILREPNPKEFDADKGSKDPQEVRLLLLQIRNTHASSLWQQGRIAEALQHSRRNVELLDESLNVLPQFKDLPADQKRNVRSGMAWLHQLLAVTALRAGKQEEAEEQQLETLALARLNVTVSGGSWNSRRALADILGFTGDLWVALRDDAKARDAYEEAVKLAREVYTQDPAPEQGRNTLNIVLIRLAGFEKVRGTDKHQKLYEEALGIARLMVKTDPEGQTHQVALALSLAPTGAHEEASEVAGKLLEVQNQTDAELLVDLARVYAQCSAAGGLNEIEAQAYQTKTLDCLAKAVDQGYRDPVYLTSHPDFAALKTASPFVELVAKITTPQN
jgi:tetratricopeptide (TPR) repeat protein